MTPITQTQLQASFPSLTVCALQTTPLSSPHCGDRPFAERTFTAAERLGIPSLGTGPRLHVFQPPSALAVTLEFLDFRRKRGALDVAKYENVVRNAVAHLPPDKWFGTAWTLADGIYEENRELREVSVAYLEKILNDARFPARHRDAVARQLAFGLGGTSRDACLSALRLLAPILDDLPHDIRRTIFRDTESLARQEGDREVRYWATQLLKGHRYRDVQPPLRR